MRASDTITDRRASAGSAVSRWARAPALLAAVVGGAILLVGLFQCLAWTERPFPGFLVQENRVVTTVRAYSWLIAGDLLRSTVTHVDGEPVATGLDIYRRVETQAPGTPIEYTFVKGGRATSVQLPVRLWSVADFLQVYGVLVLFGLASLAMGVVVGYMQPQKTPARVFLWQSFVASLLAGTSFFLHSAAYPFWGRVCLAAEAFFPAVFIHLALVFPVQADLGRYHRYWMTLPYVVSAALYARVLIGFDAAAPDPTPWQAVAGYIGFSIVFFVCAMLFAYGQRPEAIVRQRIKALLPGLVVGTALCLGIFVDNAIGGSLPEQAGLLFPFFFFGSIAYSIAKHDLFDVDRVVRQSVVYAVLTLIVLLVYGVVVSVVGPWLAPELSRGPVFGALIALALALSLDPLRRSVQSLIDRAFYRSKLDDRATIEELSDRMTTLLDLQEVVDSVTQVVSGSLQLERAGVACFPSEDDDGALWLREATGSLTKEPLPEALRDVGQRGEGDTVLEDALRTPMTLPLIVRERPIGLLLLGPKRSGLPLGSEEVRLLRTLANQTAIAMQNALSYRELRELTDALDQKVQHRTEELRRSNEDLATAYDDLQAAQSQLVQSEKMASLGQLVAGVAHELNNPASFVYGGIQNLGEYLERILRVMRTYEALPLGEEAKAALDDMRKQARLDYLLAETPQLLRICSEGSQRIRDIVSDLKVFARADQGHRKPTNIAGEIDKGIELLGSRLEGIVLEREFDDVPPVEADDQQLARAITNLLANAADALTDRPDPCIAIAVRLGAPTSGGTPEAVEIEIRDNGAGMDEATVHRVFEPFFTTKPIGQGTGLGMSIVYGAVNVHGGTIDVESALGRGTTVCLRLPIKQAGARPGVRRPE